MEIQQLYKDIQLLEKDLLIINNRKKNIHLVFDQVSGWSGRVVNKLNQQILNNLGRPIHTNNTGKNKLQISEVFQDITDVVCDKLDEIIQQNSQRKQQNAEAGLEDQSDKGFANELLDNQFMEIATSEFMSKNIRVRPNSGITAGGEKDDQKSEYFRANMLSSTHDGTQMDDEEKFNSDAIYEMDKIRLDIKNKRQALADKELKLAMQEAQQKVQKAKKMNTSTPFTLLSLPAFAETAFLSY